MGRFAMIQVGPVRLRAALLLVLCSVSSLCAATELCSEDGKRQLQSVGVTAEQLAKLCPTMAPAPSGAREAAVPNQPAAIATTGGRPRIGLALGGGGARGIAHIGVIRMLEELHVPVDYIAGTSMGSIIGGLYACGYTPDAIEQLVGSIDWAGIFDDAPSRPHQPFRVKENDYLHLSPLEVGLDPKRGGIVLPPALIAGNKLGFVLKTATQSCASISNFDQLRIPFRAVATDIQTGQPYIMGSGNLANSIRASMAIPAGFTPVEIDGHLLIDGGEAQNLPVQTVRAMGADIVIAVNVGSSGAAKVEKPGNVGAMLGRLIDLPLQQNTQASAKLADVVIVPDLDAYGSADFAKGLEMVPLGHRAAMASKDRLAQWAAPAASYAAWKAHHDVEQPPPPVIQRIEIEPVAGLDPRRIESLVRAELGQPLDNRMLAEDLTRIYGLGNFESVRYTLVPEADQTTALRISATPKSWGPTYLNAGLSLATDFERTTEFGLTALVNATELNRLGAQLKTVARIGTPADLETRFFQPLGYDSHFFLSPYVGLQQYDIQFWDEAGTQTTGKSQIRRSHAGLDLGYGFENWGEMRVGYLRDERNIRNKVGEGNSSTHAQGALTARFTIDRLDNVDLPHEGYLLVVDYIGNHKDLGATSNYDKLSARIDAAHTIDRWTANLALEYGSTLNTTVKGLDRYSLAGLFRLSGRPIRQLRGEELLLGTAQVYYRLTGTGEGLIKNISVGGSLETGNTWLTRDDVDYGDLETAASLFVITDTAVGPFFLGYGHSGDFGSWYLYLNRSF